MVSVLHPGKKNYKKINDIILKILFMGLKKLFVVARIVAARVLFMLLFFLSPVLHAQQYDILIKNGHVIDPKNHIDTIKDIAVASGKIAKVADDIPIGQS